MREETLWVVVVILFIATIKVKLYDTIFVLCFFFYANNRRDFLESGERGRKMEIVSVCVCVCVVI